DARTQTLADADPNTDAPPINNVCDPGAIPDPLTISGVAEDLIGGDEVGGVTIGAYLSGNGVAVDEVVSGGAGDYSLSLPTGGQAWIGEIRATGDGYIPAHVYPSQLNRDFTDLTLPMLTPSARTLAGLAAGVSIDEDEALVIGFVLDCDEEPVAGVSITHNLTSGVQSYLVDGAPYLDEDATETTAEGATIILNAVANGGTTTLVADIGGETQEVTVDIIPGEITVAIFLP
ncbi:MAG: hypothetical protein GY811_23195, partial [Myxococcales bacterium]|nr:hypothetical protein [Myxococcales bacterium]